MDTDRGTNVLFDLWLAARAATTVLDEALTGSGLTADEFAVYSVLSSQALTPTELAHWMSAPATTVSSVVRRFERRGHVRRLPHPHDRRSYRLELTTAGRAAHRQAGTRFLPVLDGVERGLEVADVRSALADLVAALRAASGDAPGDPPA